jgi:hypothetical protein
MRYLRSRGRHAGIPRIICRTTAGRRDTVERGVASKEYAELLRSFMGLRVHSKKSWCALPTLRVMRYLKAYCVLRGLIASPLKFVLVMVRLHILLGNLELFALANHLVIHDLSFLQAQKELTSLRLPNISSSIPPVKCASVVFSNIYRLMTF